MIAVDSGIADVGQGTPVTPARPEIEDWEHSVVVDPDCADHQKADHVSEIGWPELEKFCSKCRIGWRHLDFDHQQGDGDSEAQIAKTPSLNASKRVVSTLTSSASSRC